MESNQNDYHISFFKPTTDNARRNRNLVVQFVLIWAVAIFGFQILLKLVERPTPEPAYLVYQAEWPKVISGDYDANSLMSVSRSALSILGKVSIDPGARNALDNLISWAAYNIADSTQRSDLMQRLTAFEEIAATTDDITAADYKEAKNALVPLMLQLYDLENYDVRGKIAALEIKSGMMSELAPESVNKIEEAMDFYLIHNGSFLTEARFLGFPFHYFYTAIFLLVLFVGICWLYCIRTDMFHRKYAIED